MEYFSKDFYPKLTSILEKYIPPYLELIKDKTNSYFEQRLDISLKEAIRSFQEKLRNEYQLESQENITLLTSDYNRKIKNLEQEICNLNVKLDDKKEEINSINLQLKETEILSAKTFNKKDSFNKETSELPLSSPTEDGLNEKTMKELLNIAKEMNMQRYSSLSKKMLIQLIRSEIKTKIQFPF